MPSESSLQGVEEEEISWARMEGFPEEGAQLCGKWVSTKATGSKSEDLLDWDRFLLPLWSKLTPRQMAAVDLGPETWQRKTNTHPEPPLATCILQVQDCLDFQPRLVFGKQSWFRGSASGKRKTKKEVLTGGYKAVSEIHL